MRFAFIQDALHVYMHTHASQATTLCCDLYSCKMYLKYICTHMRFAGDNIVLIRGYNFPAHGTWMVQFGEQGDVTDEMKV